MNSAFLHRARAFNGSVADGYLPSGQALSGDATTRATNALTASEATARASRSLEPATAIALARKPVEDTHTDTLLETFQATHRQATQRAQRTRVLLNILGIALFLAAWEALPYALPWMNPALFPPPSRVLDTALPMITSGELLGHILASLRRAALGFSIALVLGITVGFLTARVRVLHHLSEPVLHGFRSVPSLAVVPLAVLWFGIGETPKVALIAWGAFFPIWITTFIGVRDTHIVYLRSAASLGAGRLQTIFMVILPAALPMILAGVRQAIAVSLIVLVAAELSGSTQGIAHMMSLGHQLFQVEIMFVGLVLLGAFGFIADRVFVRFSRRLFPWYTTAS